MMMIKNDLQAFKTGRKIGNILGVNVNSTQKNKVLVIIRDLLARKRKFYMVTPNPEIILLAQKDQKLMQVLNNADLAIPDGVALLAANKFLALRMSKQDIVNFLKLIYFWLLYFYVLTFNKRRLRSELRLIKGRELFMSLISLANKNSWRIFFLGGLGREVEISKQKLEISYKKIKLQAFAGPKLNKQAEPISENDRTIQYDAVKRINEFAPKILFVGFGAPKQEKWIAKWLPKLNVGGAMAVGGTFSYLAGHSQLPPKWMEKAGLEWFWRLLTEPQRLGRIFKAVVVFPIKVLIEKFISKNLI